MPLSLHDLIALNDEIAALVRAGVPLEQGLSSLGSELPKDLGRISQMLAERLAKGETLPEVLASCRDQFPPLYRAVVEAGIKAGRLPVALEGMGRIVRRLVELRRLVVLAMVYPLMVLMVCYGLFLLLIMKITPVLLHAAPLRNPPAIVGAAARLGARVDLWGPILPAVVAAAVAVWWYRSRQALALHAGTTGRLFGWIPSFRRLLRDGRTASFAEMLALLVDHQVPLAEAVVLAAEAGGDPLLLVSAHQLAAAISAGNISSGGFPPTEPAASRAGGIPPLLRWLIVTGAQRPTLAAALRQSADTYRRRAIRRADWLRLYLPALLTVTIGGTVALAYALTLFVPWSALLFRLSQP